MPLHPALVHLPLGLSIAIPVLAVVFTILVWTRRTSGRTWLIVLLLQALMCGATWIAIEAGERDEDLVKPMVGKPLLEQHERAASWLLWSSLGTLLAIALVARQTDGVRLRAGSIAATTLTIAVALLAVHAGHLGGELVYVHGAAQAHVRSASRGVQAPPPAGDPDARNAAHHDEH